MRFANKIVNYWIKIVCPTVNIEATFFKHVTRNLHHKRNQMTPIAMETLLAPVSFCQKNKYLHFQLLKVGQGHHVLTLIIWLAGVNGPCLRQKLGSSRTVVIATAQHVSFCFMINLSGARFEEHWAHFSISRDILYSVFYHFSCKPYGIITFLICRIEIC